MNPRLPVWLLAVTTIAIAAPLSAGALNDIREVNSSLIEAFQNQGTIDVSMVQLALERRRGLIAQLIAEDPEAVKSARLPADLVDRLKLAVPGAESSVEEDGVWTGSLEVLAVMDFEHHTAKTKRILHFPDGRLELFGGAKTFHHTDSLGGATLHIRGIRAQDVIAVDSIQTEAAPLPVPTLGAQNIAVIVVTSPGIPTFPAPWNVSTPTLLSMISNVFFGTSGTTLNTFWQASSYGVTSAQGNVYGPFVVPNYTCSGVADTEILRQNAMKAASATIDVTQYSRYAIVFPNNNCGYGGTASVGPYTYPEVPGFSSISWYPIFAGQSVSVTVRVVCHEMGHNLGMNHGNSEDYGAIPLDAPGVDGINTEYGDVYNIMGSGGEGEACGSIRPSRWSRFSAG